MCGRLNVTDSPAVQIVMDIIGMPLYPKRPPRFNVAPSTVLPVLSGNEFIDMEWGIQFGKFKHPNTRTDTIKQKPYFQKLLKENRVIVPANGFYEWPDKKARPKYKNIKTRFYIHTPENAMLFGGIYRISTDGVMQFNIITTEPNEEINDFHHRMPVIIPPAKATQWQAAKDVEELYDLLVPYTDPLTIYECDPYVDNARHEGPQCVEPLKAVGGQGSLF